MNKLLYFTGSPLYRLENKVVLTVLYLWCISSSNHFSSILERVSLPAESSSYIGGSKNFHQMLPELEEMESLMILLPHYPTLFFPECSCHWNHYFLNQSTYQSIINQLMMIRVPWVVIKLHPFLEMHD